MSFFILLICLFLVRGEYLPYCSQLTAPAIYFMVIIAHFHTWGILYSHIVMEPEVCAKCQQSL